MNPRSCCSDVSRDCPRVVLLSYRRRSHKSARSSIPTSRTCKDNSISTAQKGKRYIQLLCSRLPTQPCTDNSHDESIFSYTSGRFLFNEAARLRERHVKFKVAALLLAAEACVGKNHGRAARIRKLAEGGFNRVFIVTFEDSHELIAKIPYHIAQPEFYATASEAATLTFLRGKGIPVPEVYDYSATGQNPVGTEYIHMEKAPGECLTSSWNSMSDLHIRRLSHSFVELERKLFGLHFGATGSIYFKRDIPSSIQAPLFQDEQSSQLGPFCIGPIADYMFWYGRRATLQLNRGPWKNPVDYLRASADKEIEWTKLYGKPMEPDFPHNAIELGV